MREKPLLVRHTTKCTKILLKPGEEAATVQWVLEQLGSDFDSGAVGAASEESDEDPELEVSDGENEDQADQDPEAESDEERYPGLRCAQRETAARDKALRDLKADPRVGNAWWNKSRNALAIRAVGPGKQKYDRIVGRLGRLRKNRASESDFCAAYSRAVADLLGLL